jgi:ABC-type nitrate/sulfonate/bicarbonate transport system permease component
MSRRALSSVLEFLVPLLLLAFLWIYTSDSTSFVMPPLRDIAQAFRENWLFARVPTDLAPSVGRLLAGYGLSIVVGVALGVLIGLSPVASAMGSGILDFLRSMPGVALIPFAMLVFGIDTTMKVFVIFFGAVWPILLNTIDGVRSVSGQLLDMARCFHIGPRHRLLAIILPAASPQIFSGMRTSLSISVIMMVISEMLASSNGVGFAALQAQRTFAIKEMWAGIILLGLLGYVLNLLFLMIERRVLHWHRAMTLQGRQV